jgi:hypothetical protein
MEINGVIITFEQVMLALTGTGGIGVILFQALKYLKLFKEYSEGRVERKAIEQSNRTVVINKDAQIDELKSAVAKMLNVMSGMTEMVNLIGQTTQTNPEILAKYERIYNDIKSISAFSFENGKKVVEKVIERANETIVDVKAFAKEFDEKTEGTALGEILKKAGI